MFVGSAAASAGGAAAVLTPVSEAGPARRLALVGAAAEEIATFTMEHRLGEVGEPYHQGDAGTYAKAAKALTAAGALTLAGLGGRRRSAAIGGGAMMLAGSMCLRWSVFRAGFASAADPKYVVNLQRERLAARERNRHDPRSFGS